MSGFGPVLLPWRARPYKLMGFTLLELMIAVSIIGVLAALVVPEANRSLQRSKINEVALELAGWLESLRINNTSDVSCVATFNQAAVQPLGVSTILYTISSVQQAGTNVLAPSCTQYIDNFRIGLSGVSGMFRVASPATFQYTRRGNIIMPPVLRMSALMGRFELSKKISLKSRINLVYAFQLLFLFVKVLVFLSFCWL